MWSLHYMEEQINFVLVLSGTYKLSPQAPEICWSELK